MVGKEDVRLYVLGFGNFSWGELLNFGGVYRIIGGCFFWNDFDRAFLVAHLVSINTDFFFGHFLKCKFGGEVMQFFFFLMDGSNTS